MAKRKRGGQPNNKNAFKHGIYSGLYGPDAEKVFEQALGVDPKDLRQEIAVLRTTLAQVVNIEKGNVEVLALVARTLTRMVAVNYGLNKDEQNELHGSFLELIDELRRGTYDPDDEDKMENSSDVA